MGRGGAEAGRGAAEIEAVETERGACVRVMRSRGMGTGSGGMDGYGDTFDV